MAKARKPLSRTLGQTEIHSWFERDNAHVELRDIRTQKTILEWRDDEVADAVQDGFLDTRHGERGMHKSAYEYAVSLGLIR